MQVLPLNTIYSGYVSGQDKVLNMYPHQSGVDGLTFYGDLSLQKAQQLVVSPAGQDLSPAKGRGYGHARARSRRQQSQRGYRSKH